MRILFKRDRVKKYFPCFPEHVSSLLIFVFLFASIGSIGASVFLWPAAAEAQGAQKAILHRHHPLVREAIEVQHRHITRLMGIRDVVGTGVGIGPDGLPVIKVYTARAGVPGIPEWLESIPVHVEVTGMVVALGDTTARYRPAPIGVSTGHPAITAGTIGCRVTDGTNVYALSNNHVYANQNEASIGDSALQPGAYDGGIDPADKIGTLYDFEPIDFTLSGVNYIDAAIAISLMDLGGNYLVGNSTLLDGYGTPNSETTTASVGLDVQKYGRTTGLTRGEVKEINVNIEVCYEQWWIFCVKSAYFYDQIAISPGNFSAGGDSGSLIVTDDANKNPVGLLFAGSSTRTFANRIDLVLNRFNVAIDGEGAISNYPPNADFSFTTSGLTAYFTDTSTDPDGTIASWSWDFGDGSTSTEQNPTHTYGTSGTYNVTLTVTDNGGASDTVTKPVTVGGMHVGDLDGSKARYSSARWNATVNIAVHDPNHNPVSSATVKGSWKVGTSTYSGSCKTGSNGRCSITRSRISNSISSVTFTVNSVTRSSMTYNPGANHDPDGDSNGTNITIKKP